jgi:glucose-1-phosphate thymidylyltransferase
MKAIIPVAGTGMRLRPLTYTQPKPLIPVAGKPIISFIVDQLIELGVQDFVFIIGYLGEKIREYIERTYPELHTVFVSQDERLGSAHAIWLARDHYADAEEIIIFFGDAIIDADLGDFKDSLTSCLGVQKVDDPRKFGVVDHDINGNIRALIEKPRIPKSNLAMVGCYKVREVEQFIEACSYNIDNQFKSLDEYHLTDALNRMLEWGTAFSTDDPPPFDNSIIIHPVHIGPNCDISNSIVGPYVTLGANTKLEYAIVSDSIIGEFASIRNIVLRDSVVGNDASIGGLRQSLNIGDNTEIDFGG